MSFLKTLHFIFSDEFTELQTLLFKNYSGYRMKDAISQLERILEEQERINNTAAYGVQEIKAVRVDISQIYELCETLKSRNDTADKKTDYALSKEDVVQIVAMALEHCKGIEQEELGAIRQQEMTINHQLSGIAAYSQAADKKLNDIYQLLEAQNDFMVRQQSIPVSEYSQPAQISILEKQIEQLNQELGMYRSRYESLLEENKGLKQQLQSRIQDQAQSQGRKEETVTLQIENPYIINVNQDKYLISGDDKEGAVSKLGNTLILDQFFEDIASDNSYKKMYERYKKKLRKCISEADDDELEDLLGAVVSVIQSDLLKKIMVAIYRGKKGESSEFEDKLLQVVNRYLESTGFYTRDNLRVGNILKNEDFEDMEFIKDERTTGKKHGEITEIELYPYYINYVDEDGKKRNTHTQGMMIVIA